MIALAWTAGASRDLRRHVAYVAQFDPDAAERINDAVEARAEWLRAAPRAGPPLHGRRMRYFRVRGTQLIIVYRVDRDALNIARVVHAKQNWR